MKLSLLTRIVLLFYLLMLHPCFSYADINDSFRIAIINGDIENAKLFLQNGANVNKIYEDQSTPLLDAVNNAYGSSDIVRLLLQYGANPSFKPAGASAVSAAVKTNNEDVIRLLRPYAEDEREFYELALFYWNRDEDSVALEYADKTLKLNPIHSDVWAIKGSIYYSQKNTKGAEIAYQHAFEASLEYLKTDKSADSYADAVWHAVLSAHFNEALRIGKEGLSLFPGSGLLAMNTGHAFLILGSKKEAMTYYKRSYTVFKQADQYGDQAAQQFADDFSSLKERYPDKLSLIGWAEKKLLEPLDFTYGEIPFGEGKGAVLNLVEEADVKKEWPPIIGILDPVFKKQLGKGLYALDLKSQLSATVVEKYSVEYDKWDAVEHMDLFFNTISGQSEQRTLFLVSKFYKAQQGKLEAIFGTIQENISKELNVQPVVHDTQIPSRSGPLPAMIASWKVKDCTVILDAFSESSLAVRSRIFYISNKGWGQYLSMINNRQTLNK
jgi:tetratricopeptide (TPR) repeat protein